MNKPKKKTIATCYVWSECVEYIEEKHKIDIRDYAGLFRKKNTNVAYQDFWHWICDTQDINNGCFMTLYSDAEEQCKYDWQKTILNLFLEEFSDDSGDATFWVEW